MNLKRIFLISLLVSLAAAAAIGIVGILSPWRQSGPLLGTMLSVGLFSLTLLGTAIVLDRRQWRVAMFVSMGVSAVGLMLFLFVVWLADSIDYPLRRELSRLMLATGAIAVAIPLAGLLSLTRFRHPALNSVRMLTIAMVFLTAGVICMISWGNPDENAFKLLGILLIVTILGVIGLPLLHKLAGMPPPSETVAAETSITLICPRCSLQQTLKSGPGRCTRCRLRISIEVEEPRCPKCAYLLYQLTEPRCPECGEPLGSDEVVTLAASGMARPVTPLTPSPQPPPGA